MIKMTPVEMAKALGSGLLSFSVTHFHADFSFNERAYRENLGWLASHKVSGLFAAGGTGEFFALTPAEVDRVVRTAVEETAGSVPVIAPGGGASALAVELAKRGFTVSGAWGNGFGALARDRCQVGFASQSITTSI
jgi:5-dehydro-4-deoxyglucarate dehydratase